MSSSGGACEAESGGLWGSLMQGLLPQRAATADRDAVREGALEKAALVVQRLTRGHAARRSHVELNRRFRLLELYARAEEKGAIVIQTYMRDHMFANRVRAAVRIEAAVRGWLVRLHPRTRPAPTSGPYSGPQFSRPGLDALRGRIFKRSRGMHRYQRRYMYIGVDKAGETALCHRVGDETGDGTGAEKCLPLSSITGVHIDSWVRYVFSVSSTSRTTRFRCETHDDLMLWTNGLSLAVTPPHVDGLEFGRPTSPTK